MCIYVTVRVGDRKSVCVCVCVCMYICARVCKKEMCERNGGREKEEEDVR